MVKIAHDAGKTLRVSIAGFKPEEYGKLARVILESEADEIEINLGCPNVWNNGEQKPIASFSRELREEIL